MHFPLTSRRVIVALVATLFATVLPIRTAWSEPVVRIADVAVAPGEVASLPHPSSHLGVRWVGDEDDQIELRWRPDAAAGWVPWTAVEVSHDLGDEARGVRLSGLLVAEDARHVEVRVVAGAPRSLDVVAIDTVHGPRRLVVDRGAVQPAAADPEDPRVAPPPIVRRAEWGADESMRGDDAPAFAPITRMSLHHTAAAEGPDPAATIRAILVYHTQANGWNDIGYNFLVDSKGRVYEGRYSREYVSDELFTGEDKNARGVIGAHTGGNNTGTVGVAILGEFGSAPPSDAAIDAVERLFAWKADRHDVDLLGKTTWSTGERSTLIGHRDAVATACPGDALYALLPEIRENADRIVQIARADLLTQGYWLLGRDGALFNFGNAQDHGGSLAVPSPVMSIAPTPSGEGYWVLSANGRISAFGDAKLHGSTEGMKLNGAVVRLEPTPTGAGYWVLGQDGGVFSFGDATFLGSMGAKKLNSPVISMAATVTGKGYWLLAGDGGVFSFGDATFFGSTGAMKLNAPVVSMAPHPAGTGYWLQAADGGIFTFGTIKFLGSVPGLKLPAIARTVQIRVTPTGRGYYVMAADGGIFTFGDAVFHGAKPGMSGNAPAVDIGLQYPRT